MRRARLGLGVAVLSLVGLGGPSTLGLAQAQSAPAPASGAQDNQQTHPADRIASLSGLDAARGRRVHRFLRELEGAIPDAIEAHHTRVRAPTAPAPNTPGSTAPLPVGTDKLLVVYQISSFELCVRRAGGDDRRQLRRARESCRSEHGIRTKLASIQIAPTPPSSRRDEGGEITLVASVHLDGAYAELELEHFEVGDLDRDGRLEVAVYTREQTEQWDAGYRGGATLTSFSERFSIFDEALRAQLALVVTAGSDYGHLLGTVDEVRRVRNGGLVLIVDDVQITCGPAQEPNDDGECYGQRRIRLEYDAEADVYRTPTP